LANGMTSTTAVRLPVSERARTLIPASGWVWICAIGALFVALHWQFIRRMFLIATNAPGHDFQAMLAHLASMQLNPDWSHILIIPFISAYYVFTKKDQLLATARRTFWPGLLFVFAGVLGYALGVWPIRNDMAQGLAMICTLFGIVLFLLGPGMMKYLWFPILYLVFTIKVSEAIWERLAWKLQIIASHSATHVLNIAGIQAEVDGSTIEMFHGLEYLGSLNVAEACAGLRMLMAFLALGVAIAFFGDRRWWQRGILMLLAVPVAVAVNVARVAVIAMLYLIDPQMAQGAFHTFIGMLMLIPAALLFMGIGWVLDRIIIYEKSAEPASKRVKPAPDGESPPNLVAPSRLPFAGLGLLFGVVVTAMAGMTYAAFLAFNRPDVMAFAGRQAPGTWLGAAFAFAIVGVVVIALARGLGKRFSLQGPNKGFTLALGLVFGIMLTATFGFNRVLAANKVVTLRYPLELRQSLTMNMPRELGTFTMIREDPPLPPEQQEALGTDIYISRIYQDMTWPETEPGALMRLHVAYYTGTVDTVPHVPQRCYVAGGAQPVDESIPTIELSGSSFVNTGDRWLAVGQLDREGTTIPSPNVPMTQFAFRGGGGTSNVLYTFVANGQFLPTSKDVRLEAFSLSDRYSYYCKVEVLCVGVEDQQLAQQRVAAFLSDALPEIMACLPDWHEVKNGTYPADSAIEE